MKKPMYNIWKTKRKKKTPRQILVAKLDKVFSLYIRARDGRCVLCGKTDSLQCGHVFSRVAYSVRWDERNAYCQCSGCNLWHEYDPYPFYTWWQERYGMAAFHALHALWAKTAKFSAADLQIMLDNYQRKLDNIQRGNHD